MTPEVTLLALNNVTTTTNPVVTLLHTNSSELIILGMREGIAMLKMGYIVVSYGFEDIVKHVFKH